MDDPTRLARLLLGTAATLAQATSARGIIVAIDALPELDAVPARTLLVVRDDEDRRRIESFEKPPAAVIAVPNVELDRLGQVKLAALIALSQRVIDMADTVVFLTGPFRSQIDCVVVMTIGAEYELFDTTEQPEIDEHIKRAVFHRVLSIALQIGQHGREGRRTGALFVVGDHANVLNQSSQLVLNPFKGYDECERNLLDDTVIETVKEFSVIDGAFIIRGSGVIEAAGAHLKAGVTMTLPSGLGARHAAAAAITATTRSIAITVSQTDGTVRVWRAGRMVASFEPPGR